MTIATLIEKLEEDISWLGYNETEREIIKHIKHVITLLKEQPEIVRCKDCKHYHKGFNCDLLQKPILKGDDWFCADGKEGEVE